MQYKVRDVECEGELFLQGFDALIRKNSVGGPIQQVLEEEKLALVLPDINY